MKTREPTPAYCLSCRTRTSLALVLALFDGLVNAADGATRTWTGGSATSSYWTDAANWQGDVAPTSGDDLVFPDGAMRTSNTNSFSGGTTFRSIRITGDLYHLYGNWVRLTDGLVTEAGATVNYVLLDLRVDSDQAFVCQSPSTLALRFMGDLEIHDCTLTVDTEGTVAMYGVIIGTGGLTKTGPGTLQMRGNSRNTYTGTTTVNEGLLELSKATIAMGATAVPGPLVVGDGVGGTDSDLVRLEAWSQISDSSLVRVNRSGLLDLDGNEISIPALTLNGGHVRTGTGRLWLGGPLTNLASSVTAVIEGTLQLNLPGVRRFQIANGTANPDLLITAQIIALGSILKVGGGTLTLAGANTYQGSTRVEQGTLIVASDKALGSTAVGTVVTNSGHLRIQACDVGNETLSIDSPITLLATGPASWSGPVEFNYDAEIEVDSGVFDLRGATVFDSLTKRGAGTLRFSRAAADPLEGEVTVAAGTLELGLTAGGSFAGAMAIGDDLGGVEADVVRFVAANQLSTAATMVINSSGLLDLNGYSDLVCPLTFNGGRMQTGSGTATLLYGVTANACSSAPARIAGRLSIGGPRTFTVASGPFSPDLVVSADIRGNGGLTKRGEGEMSLSGSNSYDGLTTVSAGTLDVDHPLALGTTNNGTVVEEGGSLTLRYGVAVGEEALSLTGAGSRSGALRSIGGANAWAGAVTLAGDCLVQVPLASDALDLSGCITGTGDLTKSGIGKLRMSGSTGNTYSGDTIVEAGTLELAKTDGVAIRHGSLTIGDGDGGASADVVRFLENDQFWSTVPVTITASGLLDFDGHADTVGALTFTGGRATSGSSGGLMYLASTVTATNGSGTLQGNVYVSSTRAFNAAQASGANLYVQAQVHGLGGLTKTGPGQLYLSSSNSYEGTTTINQGRVYADDDFSLGAAGGGTVVNDGSGLVLRHGTHVGNEALALNGYGQSTLGALASIYGSNSWAGPITLASPTRLTTLQTGDYLNLSGAIGGSGDVTLAGSGTILFSGSSPNTYTGETVVGSGTLALAKSAANGAIVGDLIIGDGAGGAAADVVRLDRSAQIATVRVTLSGSGLFDLNNWAEYIGSLSGNGQVKLGSGTLSAGGDGSSTTYSGSIEGSGILRKYGSGAFTLTGNNTYTGATEIYAGRLLVNGAQPASDIEVAAAGSLGGTGTVGDIESHGAVAPGASPGQLSAGNTVLRSDSTFAVELDEFAMGTGYDQLNVQGAVKLDSPSLSVSLGYLPAVGDSFVILDNDGTDAISGNFAGLADGASLTASNAALVIDYSGGTGNDVVLTVTNVSAVSPLRFTSLETAGNGVALSWEGGVPFYVLEMKTALTNSVWQPVTPPIRATATNVPMNTPGGFYRVKGWNRL